MIVVVIKRAEDEKEKKKKKKKKTKAEKSIEEWCCITSVPNTPFVFSPGVCNECG